MKLIDEFKKFASRGSVVDLAVGVIIGGAFGKIVSSLVADVIMPPIGLLVGGIRFTDLAITLKEATEGNAAVTINYGNFLQASFDFLIVAFAIFMMVKGLNRLQTPKEAPKPAGPSAQEKLLMEIRDVLKDKA
ncbi:MAG: large-conductance mechanosensitive channel protein MscL [Bacteroidetes bacterium]|nr:large-conductance mechanosensitive channel protein MscL [Bacteroidota bacterium]